MKKSTDQYFNQNKINYRNQLGCQTNNYLNSKWIYWRFSASQPKSGSKILGSCKTRSLRFCSWWLSWMLRIWSAIWRPYSSSKFCCTRESRLPGIPSYWHASKSLRACSTSGLRCAVTSVWAGYARVARCASHRSAKSPSQRVQRKFQKTLFNEEWRLNTDQRLNELLRRDQQKFLHKNFNIEPRIKGKSEKLQPTTTFLSSCCSHAPIWKEKLYYGTQ